jgi:hypothetical protein
MSGARRRSAGTPRRKKTAPGPARTAVVRMNCINRSGVAPKVICSQWWKDGIRCPPISATKTGSVRSAAITKARR